MCAFSLHLHPSSLETHKYSIDRTYYDLLPLEKVLWLNTLPYTTSFSLHINWWGMLSKAFPPMDYDNTGTTKMNFGNQERSLCMWHSTMQLKKIICSYRIPLRGHIQPFSTSTTITTTTTQQPITTTTRNAVLQFYHDPPPPSPQLEERSAHSKSRMWIPVTRWSWSAYPIITTSWTSDQST